MSWLGFNDGRPGYIRTMARQRCPNCRRGFVYRNGSARNNLCPACGIRIEREPGYYTGALYLGVLLAFPIVVLLTVLVLYLAPSLDPPLAILIAGVGLVPLLPVINRVSYVFWMAIDRGVARDDQDDPPPPDPAPKDDDPTPMPVGGASPLPESGSRLEVAEEDHADAL